MSDCHSTHEVSIVSSSVADFRICPCFLYLSHWMLLRKASDHSGQLARTVSPSKESSLQTVGTFIEVPTEVVSIDIKLSRKQSCEAVEK